MGRPKLNKPAIHQPTMLLKWRRSKGLTQSDIATGLKHPVSTTTIGRLEDGIHPYNQELLEDIADFLDVSVSDLLYIDPDDVSGSVRKLLQQSSLLRDGVGKVLAESLTPYTVPGGSKPS